MPKYSLRVIRAMEIVGENVRVARIRRRLTQRDLAMKMGVTVASVQRLERGECGVAVGTLASALLAMGCLEQCEQLLDPLSDVGGFGTDLSHLPQRVRNKPARHRQSTGIAGDDELKPKAF